MICSRFFETHDINQVRRIQKRIIDSIKDDFGRYRDGRDEDKINETLKLRAEACLESLPAQLSKEYKKFKYSLVNAKGNSPEKADGLQYLVDVGLVIKAYNTRELSYPLEGAKIASECKASNTRATSMKFVLANPKRFGTHKAIKIADTNIGQGEGFKTYPLYSLGFIGKNTEKFIVPSPDVAALQVPE